MGQLTFTPSPSQHDLVLPHFKLMQSLLAAHPNCFPGEIVNDSRLFVDEVMVPPDIRIETDSATIDGLRLDQPLFEKKIERVVYGGS